jgi:hypothetical protein
MTGTLDSPAIGIVPECGGLEPPEEPMNEDKGIVRGRGTL